MVEVRAAVGPEDVELVRVLMREYGAYLAASRAGICLGGLQQELAGLPGPYIAPGGLWLAWMDGEALGCVAMRPLPPDGAAAQAHASASGGPALELKRLWVRPEARGQRLGRLLIETAIAAARAARARTLYLDTVPAVMAEAHALYGRMGFKPVARYNENPVDGVEFFRLELA